MKHYINKILGIILSIAICLTGGTLQADTLRVHAEETVSDDSLWQYTVNEDGTGTVTGYSGTYASEMNIPAEIDGVAITAVGEGSSLFSPTTIINKVTIPTGITRIDDYAFANCSGLSEMALPDTLTSIGAYAFYYCSVLEELSIPAGVTDIEDGAICYCPSLNTLTVSPDNTVYDSRDNCNAIIKTGTNTLKAGCQQTVIPDTVKKIGNYAFDGCTGLTELTIPEGVTGIGDSAFGNCTGLASVKLPETINSIGTNAFYCCSSLTEINIPEGVTTLEQWTFYGCWNLEIVTLPYSLTFIGSNCFRECTTLQELVIPDRVAAIDSYAFQNCSSLTSVTLPRCLSSVDDCSFYGCTALEAIAIPKQVSSISSQAFSGCTSLREVNINEGVASIELDSFSGCTDALTFYTTEGSYAASYAGENDITVSYVEKDEWDDFANSISDYVSADASDTTGRIDEFMAGLYLEYNDTEITNILNGQTISGDGDYMLLYKADDVITSIEKLSLVTNLKTLSENKQTSGFVTVTDLSVQYNGQISRTTELDTAGNYWMKEMWEEHSVYGYDILSEIQATSDAGLTLLPGDILQVHFTVSGMGMEDPTPTPTATPIADQDQAFLMFTDGNWGWGNWDTRASGGFGRDAKITGDGDYAVSIDADGWAAANKDTEGFALSAADGTTVFCIDFMNLCNSPNLDVSGMEVSNVKVYADNKTVSINASKILMGDIDGKGNFRMEFANQYGDTNSDPALDIDSLTFKSSLKVTFTLSGIKKGTSQGAFSCDSDGDNRNDTYAKITGAVDTWSAAGVADPQPIFTSLMQSASPEPTATVKPVIASPKPAASAAGSNPSQTPKASIYPGATPAPRKTSTPSISTTSAPVYQSSLKVSGVKARNTKKLKAGYLYVPQIQLSWQKNAAAAGYEIWRKAPEAGKYTKVDTLTSFSTVTWTDTSVQRGRTYCYKIRLYQINSRGEIAEGVYSSVVRLTVKTSLKKPVISTKRMGSRLTLTFKKAEGSKYQTRYRYLGDKKWKQLPAMTGKKIKKKIVKRLKATGFQMQVRTYCTVNGKPVYSKWSAAKAVR